MNNNLKRLIDLADKVFAVKNDPSQLDVNEKVIMRLKQIHPLTVLEYKVKEGPVAWVLVIPTTQTLMENFIKGTISEKELYEQTPVGVSYDAIYLCSALVLEEYRRQGITKRLAIKAIKGISKMHPIKSLFVWPFSEEGSRAAEKIAMELKLKLYKRNS